MVVVSFVNEWVRMNESISRPMGPKSPLRGPIVPWFPLIYSVRRSTIGLCALIWRMHQSVIVCYRTSVRSPSVSVSSLLVRTETEDPLKRFQVFVTVIIQLMVAFWFLHHIPCLVLSDVSK